MGVGVGAPAGASERAPVRNQPAPVTIPETTATPSSGPADTTPSTTTDSSTSTSAAPSGVADGPDGKPSIDVLRSDANEVRAALSATAARRGDAEANLAAARRSSETAAGAATAAETAEASAAAAARRLDAQVKAAAVDAFVGSGRDVPLGILATGDAHDAAWEATVLQYRAGKLDALLDDQRVAHARLESQRRARQAAAAEAKAAEQRAGSVVDQLIAAEHAQADLVAKVDDRLDAALSEAAALAAVDAQAAAGLAAQEQDLATAAALSVTTPAPRPSAPAATPVAVTPPASAPTKTPVTKAPTTTVPRTSTAPAATPTTAPPAPPAPSGPVAAPSPVDTVAVGGFVVARSIADSFGQMLTAAQGAGISLGGSAYRDTNVQIQLRMQHCGTTDYDVWLRPASQCSPPTAIPGRSMHEKGLAIDFSCGRPLVTRNDACFAWLSANASSYGFYNLPSEPWHWSTNGN